MDSDYIQHIRYKLQKRLKRLNTADFQSFHFVLKQSWGFLQENEVARGILEDIARRFPTCEQDAEKTISGSPQIGLTESENDAICYWVIKKCAEATNPMDVIINIGHIIDRTASKHNDAIEAFRLTYLEPLFDYIDEQIDDKRITLVLLNKYKHRCEWFRRANMYSTYKDDTGRGEKTLARDLYEYLHDQGLEFHIEPESASGRVDFISAQTGRDRLIADAKLFNPSRGQDTGYIAKGFRQLYDYTKDFNESFGYLVVFKTCEEDLSIQTPHQEYGVPFVTHNNKTIFFVIIDIFDYPDPASKRGKLKAYEITPEQLIESISSESGVDQG